jgi:hypothetical protein
VAAAVMVVVSHREHLAAANAESAFTPCFFLDSRVKGQAYLPQSLY